MRGQQGWSLPPGAKSPRDLRLPPGGPSGLPLREASYNVFPAWLYPPRNAVRFNQRTPATSAAAGAVTPLPFDKPIRWDQGQVAALYTYEIAVINATVLTDVHFAVLFNNAPIPGLDDLQCVATNAAAVISGDTVYLPLGQGGELTVRADNQGASAFDVMVQVTGWLYSPQETAEVADRSVVYSANG